MSHVSAGYTGDNYRSHKSYLIGFVLSIILTVIPFVMVMQDCASKGTLITVTIVCAIVQILVHLVYFLHLGTSSEQQWYLIAFVFTMLIIAILFVGSLWIMWHLNYHLMGH